jgi:hypothetical protein
VRRWFLWCSLGGLGVSGLFARIAAGDIDITIGAWKHVPGVTGEPRAARSAIIYGLSIGLIRMTEGKPKERVVITSHPVKSPVAGLGVPKHARSTKRQTLQVGQAISHVLLCTP